MNVACDTMKREPRELTVLYLEERKQYPPFHDGVPRPRKEWEV